MLTTLKQNIIDSYGWLKSRIAENKQRVGAVFCVFLALIGFFMPFMSARADVTFSGIMNNELVVVSPEYDIVRFNLGDFVLQKPIDDFQIYGIPLGKIEVFDQPVLEILRNPLPDKGIISDVNETLSSPAFDFLIDPKVQEIIATKISNGEQINLIFTDIWNVIQSAKSIAGAVNEASIQARQSMDQVNSFMKTIDGYKTTANGVILILFLVNIAMAVLILYKRANLGLSIFISGVMTVLFLALGIGTAAADQKINEQLTLISNQVNGNILEMIRSILTGTFGEIGTFIANYIGEQASFLQMSFVIQLEPGYWMLLLSSAGCLAFLIWAAKIEKRRPQ
jgi:hypothetical protein